MSNLVLIDTSAWTQALRRNGDPDVRERVQQLMFGSAAAWCDAVRLELWKGARGEQERAKLREMERMVPSLPITAEVWEDACRYAEQARTSGLNVPAIDLVIFACAKVHGVRIEHKDRHYDLLSALP